MLRALAFLLIIIGLIPDALAQGTALCEVSQHIEVEGPDAISYLDVYSSDGRTQVIQSSVHVGQSQQSITHSLISELNAYNESTPEARRTSLANGIRRYLQSQSELIVQWRTLATSVQSLHQEEPFAYVGLEQPDTSEVQHRSEYVQRVALLRERLRTELQGQLTDQDLDDLMLALLGVEDYLRLPENEFARLPYLPTEDAALFEQFIQHVRACTQLMQSLRHATEGTEYQSAFEALDATVGEENGQVEYGMERDRFIAALVAGGAINDDTRQSLRTDFDHCDFFYNESRDAELARRMLHELPEGRGFISRGAGHRAAVQRHFLDQCQNPTAAAAEAAEDNLGTE